MTNWRIPLGNPTYGSDEVLEAVQAMLEKKITMGERTLKAEEMWSKWLGVKHTILTTSGSTANTLALAALLEYDRQNGEVIMKSVATPALTWATTVFPQVQLGLTPTFVDCRLDTLNMDERQLVDYQFESDILMPVHFLGAPCNMDILSGICNDLGPYLLEDACEAPGAMWRGRKVGTFGIASTFSFYFSHHLTSGGEGGAVCTNNEALAEICRSLRSFGNIRYLKEKEEIAKEYPFFDKRHIFVRVGYNFKPTDIQAAFLLHQIPKLDRMIAERRRTAEKWVKALEPYWYVLRPVREEMVGDFMPFNSRMGFPLMIQPQAIFAKEMLMKFLESKGIETRQLEVGNMAEQPAAKKFYWTTLPGGLPNTVYALRNGFFIGCNGLSQEDEDYVIACFKEFFHPVST